MSDRLVAFQSSAGVRTVIEISCDPIASIASRMIWTTFSWTRQPSGRNVHRPALTWRMKAPRTSSLWLIASASAGASRRVGRKSCDARRITPRTLVEGNFGSLGHGQRGRLRHLEALRAAHPGLDPRVDLREEIVDERLGRHLLQHASMGVDEADIPAAGDPEVRVPGLTRAVHRTAHDRNLEGLRIVPQPL